MSDMDQISEVAKFPARCPKCGAAHRYSDSDDYHEYTCSSFKWRGRFNQEQRCAIRAEAILPLICDINALQEQLTTVTAERDALKEELEVYGISHNGGMPEDASRGPGANQNNRNEVTQKEGRLGPPTQMTEEKAREVK